NYIFWRGVSPAPFGTLAVPSFTPSPTVTPPFAAVYPVRGGGECNDLIRCVSGSCVRLYFLPVSCATGSCAQLHILTCQQHVSPYHGLQQFVNVAQLTG